MKKRLGYAGMAATLLGSVLVMSTPAQAAVSQNGVCESGEFCLYYNSDRTGSLSDFRGSISDYGTTYKFLSAGAGQGLPVKNNAASVRNRTFGEVKVFYNSNYGGASQPVAPGAGVNLNATLKNQNASHRIGRTYMSVGLYKAYGGRLTSAFDGYSRPELGRHEGIDFAKGLDVPVYALVGGKVTAVVPGSRGSGSARLSTIAVYNPILNKTIIYLHAAPSVTKDQVITKGQKIGLEDYRGASATHTHVEMRSGLQTRASVSGDSNLDNTNPTSFWNSQGYEVR